MFDRRMVVGGALAAGLVGVAGARAAVPGLADLAQRSGGRLGVFALDTGSGRSIGHDADSRYALCSTFKVLLGAAVLARVDAGGLALDTPLAFTDADVLAYAPVTKQHLATHRLTVAEACAAAIELSDNSAANLLLHRIGGPAGLTRFIRGAGDNITRLDRYETALNLVPPGEVRDTTTPRAMAGLLQTLLLGKTLLPQSRKQLLRWMVACQTGKAKLRAGLPAGWLVGDKTGNSGDGKINDAAIAIPPHRSPILIASYLDAPKLDAAAVDAIHAGVGRAVAAALG
ncbi:class A beta-lactamase [Hephaestia mangrovi]|uniref:class A beta-lactamase n=1 Tax=Hephaestia mangrovi TaxID=2873268 RepID=UPI001CA6E703|nr:class A beta-lactamase [Hephaestia mangrovi]MBY8827104.1 class A beta-lactamase [Hephaestia mangrovi]